jgi:hypothetical protein
MIKIFIFSSLLLATTVLGLSADSLYRKVIHNTDPEARCLDGSPSLLYVHEGGDPKNILIFFLGGGMCGGDTLEGTLENCYQRSQTDLGTSTLWPD